MTRGPWLRLLNGICIALALLGAASVSAAGEGSQAAGSAGGSAEVIDLFAS